MTTWTAESAYVCGWSMDDDCAPCRTKANLTENRPLFQRALNSAAEVLYALSGRQFGLCELKVRPCRKDNCSPCGNDGYSGFPWTPVLAGGEWTNVSCGSGKCRGRGCGCTEVCDLYLPGPIWDVTEVKIDGNVLPAYSYSVDHRRTLQSLSRPMADAAGVVTQTPFCWPKCQEMNSPDTEVNTFSVTYLRGKPLPEAGRAALAEFACELALACLGEDCCALPKRVTSISREGVSYAMLDPMTFINEGLTGLYSVDLWLRSVNPKGRSRSGAILSPDMPKYRRETRPI